MKTRDGKPIPNNPAKAFMMGVRLGTQDNMNLTAMVLCDKCGWHVRERVDGDCEEKHDTQSIEYLYNAITQLRDEIVKPGSPVKMIDVKQTIADEYKAIFED